MQKTEIRTDETMRELSPHGSASFPFAFYDEMVEQFQRSCIDWHWHREVEWGLVESGVVDCLTDAGRVRLQAGDGIFFNSRTVHRMESASGGHIPNLLFAPEFIAPADSPVYRNHVAPVTGSGLSFLVLRGGEARDQPLLTLLAGALQAGAGGSPLEIQWAVLTLWRAFVRERGVDFARSAARQGTLVQARTRSMVQFIADHFARKLTLEQIAAAAGVSKSEALRCFRCTLQTTPVRFLLDYRLEQARARLLATDDTVTSIAADCGIENVSYFVRQFAARYGETPRAFRRRNQLQ